MTQGVDERTEARLRGYVQRLSPAERIRMASMLGVSVDVGGREPPNNEEAEAAVLDAVLTGHAIDEVLEILPDPEAFFGDAHRRIYAAAITAHRLGQPVDVQTVGAALRDSGELQAVGGLANLARIVGTTPSVAHVAAHARIVREKWRVRALAGECSAIAAEAYGDYGLPQDFLSAAASKVSELADAGRVSRVQMIEEIGRDRDAEIEAQWKGEREPWGMRGSHERLHLLVQGHGLGEQTYVAADTGGGKSAFALQEARTLAGRTYQREQIGCGYLSLEMLSKKHYDRAVIQEAAREAFEQRVRPPTMGELMTGREATINPDGKPGKPGKDALDAARVWLIEHARREIRKLPIAFDDSQQDIASVRACIRKMQREQRARGAVLRFVVVDHMHIMDFPDARKEDEAIAQMVRGFNAIAKELELHLMVLAQFNRGAASAEGPPRMSHIRGSAAIEQIAHKIVILHRPWSQMSVDQKRKASEADQREAYAIVCKNRDSRQGSIPMTFTGEAFRFDEKPEDYDA